MLACRQTWKHLKYRVKWRGFDEDFDEYTPSQLMYSPHLLRDFHLRYPAARGPPRLLDQWLERWESGDDDYGELEDDRPMEGKARVAWFNTHSGSNASLL